MNCSASQINENQNEKKTLTFEDMKTFLISALGGSLEFYDFVVYVYFASIMAHLFFDTSSPFAGLILTYSVFASGYLARVLGGLIFSHFGDKNGRKNSFALTVFLMAAPTFIIGLLPTYSQIGITASILLFLCRFAQGLAIGGEIPCSITFIYEHAHKSRRGFACGIILGIFLGSIAGFIMTKFVSEETLYSWAWRIPFLVGGVLGLIGVYLRKFLNETPIFKQMKKENIKIPLKVVLKDYKIPLFQTAAAIWVVAVSVTLYLLYLPNYLITYFGYNSEEILKISSISVFIFALLIILFGVICDKIGVRKVLNFGYLLFIFFSYPIFAFFSENNFSSIYFCYTIVIIGIAASTAAGILMLAESFPTKVRYSGSSLSYNLAFGIFGGFTPLIATTLIEQTGSKISPAFYMILVSLIALVSSGIKNHHVYD
jgi:MFS family permease